jgi:hypothetical protein
VFGHDNLSVHFCGAVHRSIEVVNLEAQQNAAIFVLLVA